MKHLKRGGLHFRVCDPSWRDALDTTFAARYGGRWNSPNTFGVLYLNATIAIAAANARRAFENEIATLFDLRPEQRPDLQLVDVRLAPFVDSVTPAGLRALKLPVHYPHGVSHEKCRQIGARAYAARENGIATRSNAEATRETYLGEELAVFDTALALVARLERRPFADWYPVEAPGRSTS
ncbi:MAG: RES family NAD+ phosphorylase [Candidatus Eremiobacteraeota bacterium]|nr:RES family NAD+ phosphorylase [Candidatus Eremiobacteraeota bacterium]